MGGSTSKVTSQENQSDWMQSLTDVHRSLPVYKLAIPGSHNSGTFKLKLCNGMAADCGTGIRVGHCFLTFLTCGVSSRILEKWSQCQALSFSRQLEAGVRYFDVRVEKSDNNCCGGEESLRSVHALRGASVRKCMEEVKEFLIEHEGEIVLLDFNRFFNMEDEDHRYLAGMLEEVFYDHEKDCSMLCPYSSEKNLRDLTLNKLCEAGTRVILFYYHGDNPRKAVPEECGRFWPYIAINSQASWANTMSVDCWRKKQEREACARRTADKFYVCQGVLTPNTSVVMKNVCCTLFCCGRKGTTRTECAYKLNPVLLDWVKRDVQDCGRCVIYTADFVHEEYGGLDECDVKTFVQSVIELNQVVMKQQESA